MLGKWLKSAVTASALMLAVSFAVSPAHAETKTIKIGVPGAHSGNLAAYGLPPLNAARLVVDYYNERGGVNGMKVELLAQDDQCKPEMATNVATKLLSDGAVVVMGHICSGPTFAALPTYSNTVLMSPSSTVPELTTSGKFPTFFRTIAKDDDQAALAMQYAVDKLGAKRIAILHDQGDYGRGYAEYVKSMVEKDGRAEVIMFEGITPGAIDYAPVIQRVGREKADVVIFGGYHPEASKLVTQMQKRRLKIPFISDDGVQLDAFIKMAGKSAEGVYASGPKDISANEWYKKAREMHIKEYGEEPGQFFYQAFAATQALLNAIEKSGSTDTDKIIKALRTEYVDTPLGKIRFNERGDAEGAGFSLYQVQNGKFVELR